MIKKLLSLLLACGLCVPYPAAATALKIHTSYRAGVPATAFRSWLTTAAGEHRLVNIDGLSGYVLALSTDPTQGMGANTGVYTVTIGTANGVANITVSPAGPNAQGNLTLDIVTNPTFTGTITDSGATPLLLTQDATNGGVSIGSPSTLSTTIGTAAFSIFCQDQTNTSPGGCPSGSSPGNSNLVFEVDSTNAGTRFSAFKLTAAGNGTFGANVNAGNFTCNANGCILDAKPTIGGANVLTETLPVYSMSAAGATTIIANTLRAIVGTCTFAASTSCVSSTQAGGAVWTNAFTTNPSCFAGGNAISGLVTTVSSTNNVTLTAASSNSQTINYVCFGT